MCVCACLCMCVYFEGNSEKHTFMQSTEIKNNSHGCFSTLNFDYSSLWLCEHHNGCRRGRCTRRDEFKLLRRRLLRSLAHKGLRGPISVKNVIGIYYATMVVCRVRQWHLCAGVNFKGTVTSNVGAAKTSAIARWKLTWMYGWFLIEVLMSVCFKCLCCFTR